jgi:hypothetical protein
VKERRRRGREELLDDMKEKRGYWKLTGKHYIATCGEPAIEESMDLS